MFSTLFLQDDPMINDIGTNTIMVSARHKTLKDASVYLRDSLTRFARLSRDRFAKYEHIAPWESIRSEVLNVEDLPHTPDSCLRKELPVLADWWYTNLAKYSSTGPVPDCFTLFECALSVREMSSAAAVSAEQLEGHMMHLSASASMTEDAKRESMRSWILRFRASCIKQNNDYIVSNSTQSPEEAPHKRAAEECRIDDVATKKRKRGGSQVLTQRNDIKKARGEAKVILIWEAYHKHHECLESLAGPDQSFFHRSVRPIGQCISTCHGSSTQQFLSAHPDIGTSKFKCTTCTK
jgi:hypothetical protein